MQSYCVVARMFILAMMVSHLGLDEATGQDYPSKPIRIVTSGAGGSSDFTARLVAQGITAAFGQQVIVDNRGSGAIQGDVVSKSPPDGYTLLVAGGTFWTFPLLQKASYDPLRDFSTITYIDRSARLLAVHPSLPAKSVKELIALAKVRPGELNFSSSGRGATGHLALELFKTMTGVNIVHVPYKGGAQSITALVGGEVQITINDASLLMPHVKGGRLRPLGVTSLEPSSLAPGLPTVADSGLPGFESVGITGMFAPAKTPEATIKRVNDVVVRYINTPDVKEKFFNAGTEVMSSTPEQFAFVMRKDMERSAKLIKEIGIRID